VGAGARAGPVARGSGGAPAWFQSRGHAVTAAEPVAAFREMIAHRVPAATVVDSALPDLAGLSGQHALILVNAVWHHLGATARDQALARLAELYAVRDSLYREVASSVVESNRDEIARFARELESSLQDPLQA